MTTAPPDDPRFAQAKADFMEGLAQLEAGQCDAAERCFCASLRGVPGRVSTLVNLAAVRLLLGRPEEALDSARQALQGEPDNVDALLHQASALAQLGRAEAARRGFERLLAVDDRHVAAWTRLAETYKTLGRRDDALRAYARALALEADQPEVWSRHGDLLREAGRHDDAAQAFREALARGGDAALNGYYLAAVTGDGRASPPPTAPAAYVRGLFDGYADDFDQHLRGLLGYEAPERLARRLATHAPFQSALDLGCGTGLCGPLLRPMSRRLVGVDLSGAMLAKARVLGVYDELLQADLLEALARPAEPRHDLVVAADVFIYVGELEPVFAAVRAATTPGAIFAFTAEPPTDPRQGVQLLPSLRYAHSTDYLARLAEAQGFELLALERDVIRREQRREVEGVYVVGRRG
ncbi:tetratricopeptide repeat protein [uncultured Methylibium sp.]|uniref:tetratricopeptide repeat protein n=1 Tax=uncultured Methylibium sp. TaxID=381093 RepID=UPI0025FAE295|nr:tetratricopeptide repeat protein [uncultured Methylibium sp.]